MALLNQTATDKTNEQQHNGTWQWTGIKLRKNFHFEHCRYGNANMSICIKKKTNILKSLRKNPPLAANCWKLFNQEIYINLTFDILIHFFSLF